ncbi:MAG: acylphosphatase [Gammaproteobacteria bacterium]
MNEAPMACRRYRVSGRVQGVFFRASAREQARALGLTGWVMNCDDGSVEAIARGSADALAAFAAWLAEGPPRARVSAVTSEVCDADTGSGFEVR